MNPWIAASPSDHRNDDMGGHARSLLMKRIFGSMDDRKGSHFEDCLHGSIRSSDSSAVGFAGTRQLMLDEPNVTEGMALRFESFYVDYPSDNLNGMNISNAQKIFQKTTYLLGSTPHIYETASIVGRAP